MTNKECFLGIDLGSSFLKVCVTDQSLTVVYSAKARLPKGFYDIGRNILPTFIRLLRALVRAEEFNGGVLHGVAVSAVVPCLVAVDASLRSIKVVSSHISPPISSKTQPLDLAARVAIRRERTERAIYRYRSSSMLSRTDSLLPLGSAIGLFLTGTLAFDTISLYELGHLEPESLLDSGGMQPSRIRSANLPRLNKAPLRGVTSDTMASSIGGGLRKKGHGLLYYGTYYCALSLRSDLARLFSSERLTDVPYVWLVSLPHFGLLLEKTLELFKFARTSESRLALFERLIGDASDSDKSCITIGLNRSFDADGIPTLTLSGVGPVARHKDIANALASVLGHELRKALADEHARPQKWFAGGGGTVCIPLLQRTSDLAEVTQFKFSRSNTAYGTAILAQCRSSNYTLEFPQYDEREFLRIAPRKSRQYE